MLLSFVIVKFDFELFVPLLLLPLAIALKLIGICETTPIAEFFSIKSITKSDKSKITFQFLMCGHNNLFNFSRFQ